MKTITSVRTSNVPENTNPTAQAPRSRIARVGTRARGEIFANAGDRRPSRAIANGTRDTARLSE